MNRNTKRRKGEKHIKNRSRKEMRNEGKYKRQQKESEETLEEEREKSIT